MSRKQSGSQPHKRLVAAKLGTPGTLGNLSLRREKKTNSVGQTLALLQEAMPGNLRFGKPKLKSPHELVAKTNAALGVLSSVQSDRMVDKAIEDVGRYLEQMKIYIFGSDGHPATKENVLLLAKEVCAQGLLLGLCQNLVEIEFESRKDAALVVGALVRVNDDADQYPAVDYLADHSIILKRLFEGYKDCTIALSCGSMLRDCIRHCSLARCLLFSDWFLQFFIEIEERKFEIAADAFSTFRDALTRHKDLVAEFLKDKFDEFFTRYNTLLRSENYVTRRQLLKLLGELLLAPTNVEVMMKYASGVENLILMMNLLRDDYSNIQYEAFHVFKVFVANPNKPQGIVDILYNNKAKLLRFFDSFCNEKAVSEEEETQFKNEKEMVIKGISSINKRNGQS